MTRRHHDTKHEYVGRHRANRRKRADPALHSRREPKASNTFTDWLVAIGAITFLTFLIVGFTLTFIIALFIPW